VSGDVVRHGLPNAAAPELIDVARPDAAGICLATAIASTQR
jgi:hypothetical protein